MQDKQGKGKLGKANYSNWRNCMYKRLHSLLESESSNECIIGWRELHIQGLHSLGSRAVSLWTPIAFKMLHCWYFACKDFRAKPHRQQISPRPIYTWIHHPEPLGYKDGERHSWLAWFLGSVPDPAPSPGPSQAKPLPHAMLLLISSIFGSTSGGHIPFASQIPPAGHPDPPCHSTSETCKRLHPVGSSSHVTRPETRKRGR